MNKILLAVTGRDPNNRDTRPVRCDSEGRLIVISGVGALEGVSAVKRAVINESTGASNEIVASVPGKRIIVVNYTLLAAGTVSVTWQSNATAISGAMPLVANAGIATADTENGLFETAVGEALNLLSSDAIAVGGHLSYVEAD